MDQSWAVAGIDPHKATFTVGVVDGSGGCRGIAALAVTEDGFSELLHWLGDLEVTIGRVGVEGANGLGRQLTRFRAATGLDVREVQPNRTAERRRRRRRQKTDREDAEAIARETLAHDDLLPAGKRQSADPVWDELVAVRNRRDSLLHQRVRLLNRPNASCVFSRWRFETACQLPAGCGRASRPWLTELPTVSTCRLGTRFMSPGLSRPLLTWPSWTIECGWSSGAYRRCLPGWAPPSSRKSASALSLRWSCSSRSAIRPGSPARDSSPAGAEWHRWRRHQVRGATSLSITDSTLPGTDRSIPCFIRCTSLKPGSIRRPRSSAPGRPLLIELLVKHGRLAAGELGFIDIRTLPAASTAE